MGGPRVRGRVREGRAWEGRACRGRIPSRSRQARPSHVPCPPGSRSRQARPSHVPYPFPVATSATLPCAVSAGVSVATSATLPCVFCREAVVSSASGGPRLSRPRPFMFSHAIQEHSPALDTATRPHGRPTPFGRGCCARIPISAHSFRPCAVACPSNRAETKEAGARRARSGGPRLSRPHRPSAGGPRVGGPRLSRPHRPSAGGPRVGGPRLSRPHPHRSRSRQARPSRATHPRRSRSRQARPSRARVVPACQTPSAFASRRKVYLFRPSKRS